MFHWHPTDASIHDRLAPPSRPETKPDFVVIDVETACSRVSSICQIGIVGFRDGAFGDAAPGYGWRPIFGLVSNRGDSAIRKRVGEEWIRRAAERDAPQISVPDEPPVDPYLTRELPI